jgi:hypothetical protein
LCSVKVTDVGTENRPFVTQNRIVMPTSFDDNYYIATGAFVPWPSCCQEVISSPRNGRWMRKGKHAVKSSSGKRTQEHLVIIGF